MTTDQEQHDKGMDYVSRTPEGEVYMTSLAVARQRGGEVFRLRVGGDGQVERVLCNGSVPDVRQDVQLGLFAQDDKTHTAQESMSEVLRGYQQAYYEGKPVVSDATYDKAEAELAAQDPGNPVLRKVGAPVQGQKFRHGIPMGSLHKVQDEPSMRKWFDAHCVRPEQGVSECFVSEKLDGVSLSLQYDTGRLVQALTRGDGEFGEDVTDNAMLCKGISERVPFTGYIRGEVVVTLTDFRQHFQDMSNPRNTAAGLIRNRKDAERCKHLTFIAYRMICDDRWYGTRVAEFYKLEKLGFKTPKRWFCKSVDELSEVYADVQRIRPDLDYEIDGLVVDVNDHDVAASFGVTDGRPNGSVAWKFPHQTAETTLRDVVWQVGSTGRVTPVAVFDPVQVAGVTVERASLANEARLQELGLREGSRILVARRNDVIPRVEDNLGAGDGQAFSAPDNCPTCKYALIREGTYLVCPDVGVCPDQVQGTLQRWLDKVGVLDWGDAVLEALVRDGARDPADLYVLPEWRLAELNLPSGRRLGVANARTMVKNLNAKRDLPLHVFVGALGIPLCGRTTCKTFVDSGRDTLDKLQAATVQDLALIPGIGPARAEAFVYGLAMRWPVVRNLLENGVRVQESAQGVMKGKSMCMTGFRDGAMAAEFERQGGTVKSGVSKGLTYLVQKDPNSVSEKSKKAKEYGTQVVGIEGMWVLLRGPTT